MLADTGAAAQSLQLGRKDIAKSDIGFAAQLMMLVRSAVIVVELADKNMSEFVVDSDNHLAGL